jgi:hypothetical protein
MPQIVPLAEIQRFVLEQLQLRPGDTVIIGAQAVNAYTSVRRNTDDVDVVSTQPVAVAAMLEEALHERFHIAVRGTKTKNTTRIYQRAAHGAPKRFLVDIESVSELPPHREKFGLLVVNPEELLAMKVKAASERKHRPEGQTDRADIMRLLERFPHLRDSKEVPDRMRERGAGEAAHVLWNEIREIGRPTTSAPHGSRKRFGHSRKRALKRRYGRPGWTGESERHSIAARKGWLKRRAT